MRLSAPTRRGSRQDGVMGRDAVRTRELVLAAAWRLGADRQDVSLHALAAEAAQGNGRQ